MRLKMGVPAGKPWKPRESKAGWLWNAPKVALLSESLGSLARTRAPAAPHLRLLPGPEKKVQRLQLCRLPLRGSTGRLLAANASAKSFQSLSPGLRPISCLSLAMGNYDDASSQPIFAVLRRIDRSERALRLPRAAVLPS